MDQLDWKKLLSPKRLNADVVQETDFDARSEYQRDIDRIVFCSAFRRLQDKTQVMPLPQSDYVRSRLTHSLEVASIGRSLGNLVGKFIIEKEALENVTKDDFGNIVVAACLAHDIGNPPFGHTGEKAIGKFFERFFEDEKNEPIVSQLTDEQKSDFLKFEGNAAGLRILANDHSSGRLGGLKLTYSTLGAYSKYPTGSKNTEFNELGKATEGRKSQSKFGFFQEEREVFSKIADELGLIKLAESKKNPAWCRHPLSFLLEAADSLTYLIIDFEDAHKLGYINSIEAEEILYSIVKRTTDSRCNIDDWKSIENKDERIGALRAKALNSLIYECFSEFKDKYNDIMTGRFDKELPDCIQSTSDLDRIKQLCINSYFGHSSVIDIELAGFEVLGGLLDCFTGIIIEFEEKRRKGEKLEIKDARNKRLLLKMTSQFAEPLKSPEVSVYKKLLICADFVSRMTDGYAMKLYKKLKGIEL